MARKRRESVLIDFDGTIVEFAFPGIGKPLPGAFETMKDLKAAGYKLILWTCREDEGYKIDRQFLTQAVEYCRENGVEFDGVNETLEEDEFRPKDCKARKPHAQCVIDDRNLGGFPGWDVVREELLGSTDKRLPSDIVLDSISEDTMRGELEEIAADVLLQFCDDHSSASNGYRADAMLAALDTLVKTDADKRRLQEFVDNYFEDEYEDEEDWEEVEVEDIEAGDEITQELDGTLKRKKENDE
jgi:hypothetical protein